jgi:hypothetical protein
MNNNYYYDIDEGHKLKRTIRHIAPWTFKTDTNRLEKAGEGVRRDDTGTRAMRRLLITGGDPKYSATQKRVLAKMDMEDDLKKAELQGNVKKAGKLKMQIRKKEGIIKGFKNADKQKFCNRNVGKLVGGVLAGNLGIAAGAAIDKKRRENNYRDKTESYSYSNTDTICDNNNNPTKENDYLIETFGTFLQKRNYQMNESDYYDSEELDINDFYDVLSNDEVILDEGKVKDFVNRHKKKLIAAGAGAALAGGSLIVAKKLGGEGGVKAGYKKMGNTIKGKTDKNKDNLVGLGSVVGMGALLANSIRNMRKKYKLGKNMSDDERRKVRRSIYHVGVSLHNPSNNINDGDTAELMKNIQDFKKSKSKLDKAKIIGNGLINRM